MSLLRVALISLLPILCNVKDLFAEQVHYGHNLSPSTNTLAKNQVGVGVYAATYGVSDEFTVGTSPWITVDYNMINIVARYAFNLKNGNKLSFQGHYFSTYDEDKFDFGSLPYKMTAYSQFLGYSCDLSETIKLTLNFNGMYFWDEDRPFSLRRINATRDSYQINGTALLQSEWATNFVAQFEVGILGANYIHPRVILGSSGAFSLGESWLIQLGMMITSTVDGFSSPQRVDNNFEVGNTGFGSIENDRFDFSVHPEIQLEYFF